MCTFFTLKKWFVSFLLLFITFLAFGCSSADKVGSYDDSPSEHYGDSEAPIDDPSKPDTDSNQDGPQAGQLTASEWSDLKNYDYYKGLFVEGENQTNFRTHFNKGYFDTLHRVQVNVKTGENPISGAKVSLYDKEHTLIYQAITNANGISYLFPQASDLELIASIEVVHQDGIVTQAYQYKENDVIDISIVSTSNKQEKIEIMFVMDVTGSMGDELEYIKSEIDYVISSIKEDYGNIEIKLALLFYRDLKDSFVTRYFDFSTDITLQKSKLANIFASGGGDFEEAVDIALEEAVNKNWSSENTTKLLFHVLDAPPHYTQTTMTKYFNAIAQASTKGIRMIPVASSGIDQYTEYLLRNEAIMSGGTYVYLTDDSGIGNGHLDPTVDEKVVEYLNLLLIRLIKEYYTGVEQEKVPYYQNDQQ